MDSFQVYKDMKARTNGEIYIGVVGPVRTGKSTFIRRFAELLILPNLKEEHVKQRTQDELPQAASGTTNATGGPGENHYDNRAEVCPKRSSGCKAFR